jgi:glycosyltransferase involved in cell wall biosynthesis
MRDQEPLPRDDVDVSVLFITYNRSDLLEIAFRSIRERVDFGNLRVEFVVSDDASDPAHLSRVRSLAFDKHVLSTKNRGLGHNCNKGIAATDGRYILQIQDDCEFVGERTLISTALQILQADPEIGIVQLTHQTPDVVHEMRYLENGTWYRIYENDGISGRRDCGARPYSDQPHLKRRQFCADIGPYMEGVAMSDMEVNYQQRVACQHRWRVASMEKAPGFKHLGASRSFNPSHKRARRLALLDACSLVGPILRQLRPAVRQIRDWVRRFGRP